MRSRADRKQDFDAIKQHLFDAGTSVLKVARVSEDLFTTSVQAIVAALETEPNVLSPLPAANSIQQTLLEQQQQADTTGDVNTYLEATRKLQLLEEMELNKLEQTARRLEMETRIRVSQGQLAQLNSAPEPHVSLSPAKSWTEKGLKAKFQTLQAVRKAFGINARSWKDAVRLVNQLSLSP